MHISQTNFPGSPGAALHPDSSAFFRVSEMDGEVCTLYQFLNSCGIVPTRPKSEPPSNSSTFFHAAANRKGISVRPKSKSSCIVAPASSLVWSDLQQLPGVSSFSARGSTEASRVGFGTGWGLRLVHKDMTVLVSAKNQEVVGCVGWSKSSSRFRASRLEAFRPISNQKCQAI